MKMKNEFNLKIMKKQNFIFELFIYRKKFFAKNYLFFMIKIEIIIYIRNQFSFI